MSTSKWTGALFLAAGMALPGPVHAVSARASVTGFGIQLIDLNPTDGIAPALRMDGITVGAYISAFGPAGPDSVQVEEYGSVQREYSFGSAFSSAAPDTFLSEISLVGRGFYNSAHSNQFVLEFELTPDTAAIFSAGLAISTDGEYGYASYADAFMGAYIDGTGNVGGSIDTDNLSGDESRSDTVRFEVRAGSQALKGGFLNVGTYVYANALPVPEPVTWTMLAAGLGVVGAAFRRQGRTPCFAHYQTPYLIDGIFHSSAD